MKSFYEMMRILENIDYDAWLQKPYQDDANDWLHRSNFEVLLGEDKGEPFMVEVDVEDGEWKVARRSYSPNGSIWVAGYVPNGSENPESEPKFEKNGTYDGTTFSNPGRRLELLPPSIREKAIKWIDDQVEWHIDHAEDWRN